MYTANLSAFSTLSRHRQILREIKNLDDLLEQFEISYSPVSGSEVTMFFERMSEIEGRFYEAWKEISLNYSQTPLERSKLAVWEYPISDKYTKLWHVIQESRPPNTLEEAVSRMLSRYKMRFALIADAVGSYKISS